MNIKLLKWHLLGGQLVRRVVMRALMLVLAVIVVYLMQMATEEVRVIEPMMSNVDDCPFDLSSNAEFNLSGILDSTLDSVVPRFRASPMSCKDRENLTKFVFKLLTEMNFLQSNARALCVGEESAASALALRHMGFFDVFGVDEHQFFSLLKRRFVYELDFEDNHFDFVFSQDLDRVSVPALIVMEIERVLRPGGLGAMLVGSVRSPLFFKNSDVVHECGVGSFALVVFKKRLETFASFEHFQLPQSCPSIQNNKPYMKNIEPLTDKISAQFDPHLSYLPNSMNISSRNKLIYINLGAGEYAKTSVAKLSKPYCANHHSSFQVFIIDHKTSILSSFLMNQGFNFIYDPALAGDTARPEITSDEFLSAPVDDDGFEFIPWFKKTVFDGDFVVLLMKGNLAELNILVELFETGAICHVDELFLRCSNGADCTNVFRSLRASGVYVHQWFVD